MGCRTMCGTRWWISCGAGRRRRKSAPGDSSIGWACRPASSMTGESATGASTNTTVGSPVISGWSRGRSKRSSGFIRSNPLEGYRRLTFMMLDADVVAVSPSSVWRVLQRAGLLSRWKLKPSRKGTGFEQPPQAHQHWHIDVSYINVSGTFYYLCSVLDGYSRTIVHWDLRESMTEARNRSHSATSEREISGSETTDHLRQWAAVHRTGFQGVHTNRGYTHARTSPGYPQSNGKLERWHKSLKSECIRPGTPLTKKTRCA